MTGQLVICGICVAIRKLKSKFHNLNVIPSFACSFAVSLMHTSVKWYCMYVPLYAQKWHLFRSIVFDYMYINIMCTYYDVKS